MVVFLVEERSMEDFLNALLPRLFPALEFQCVPHEGDGWKAHTEKPLPKLPGVFGRGRTPASARRHGGQSMTEIRGWWGNVAADPAKCQGWGEFALPPFHPACGSVARRLPPVRTPLGAGWRSSRRQRPLATFRRPLAISFRRLTNRLGKVKNGRSRSSRWRFEL